MKPRLPLTKKILATISVTLGVLQGCVSQDIVQSSPPPPRRSLDNRELQAELAHIEVPDLNIEGDVRRLEGELTEAMKEAGRLVLLNEFEDQLLDAETAIQEGYNVLGRSSMTSAVWFGKAMRSIAGARARIERIKRLGFQTTELEELLSQVQADLVWLRTQIQATRAQ